MTHHGERPTREEFLETECARLRQRLAACCAVGIEMHREAGTMEPGRLHRMVYEWAERIMGEVAPDACMTESELAAEHEWVTGHGGLDAVMRRWRDRVPREHVRAADERDRRRRDRMHRHIETLEAKCGERKQTIKEMNATVCDLRGELDKTRLAYDRLAHMEPTERMAELEAENAELRKRAIPDGYEWPRFEDGEPVLVGDEAPFGRDGTMTVTGVEFTDGGHFILHGRDGGIERPCQTGYQYGQRVKRPAPKVLDADGVDIRVGDELFVIETGKTHHVAAVDAVSKRFRSMEQMSGDATWLDPMCFTHRAPALAADNEPLEVGQTVWHKGGNAHGVVESIDAGSLMRTVRYRGEDGEEYRDAAKDLTHQRPMLDADGVPIELGDDLYSVEGGIKLHVSHVDRINGKIATDAMFSLDKWADPAMYTHRAPVIAADGKPIRDGETVWSVDSGTRYTVEKITDELIPIELRSEIGTKVSLYPSQLTHERPVADSWELLEEDAGKSPCKYFDQSDGCGGCPHYPGECHKDKDKDLVRRAKALAERDA